MTTAAPSPSPSPGIEVRRAGDRPRTRTDWLDSRHSFSHGAHYDPANTHHGVLLVHDHDVLGPGGGFGTHRHRDAEIVTWVLQGTLRHEDSTGHAGVIRPGQAQRMSAGTGVSHSERNASTTEPVHLVQMQVVPDGAPADPGYDQRDVDRELRAGGLVAVASGRAGDDTGVRIGCSTAALHVARLAPGESVELPDAPWLHVYLARGDAHLEGAGPLEEGDAVRSAGSGGRRLTATTPAEVLVWEMHATLGR